MAAIGPGDPALARDHQEKLGAGGWMRADDTLEALVSLWRVGEDTCTST